MPKLRNELDSNDADCSKGYPTRPPTPARIAQPSCDNEKGAFGDRIIGKERVEENFPKYLRPKEASGYLGIAESTLAKLRMSHRRDEGPPYVRIGKSVIYDRDRLDAWLADRTVH